MDSTPPSRRSEPRSRIKSASRLARIDFSSKNEELPQLSLDLIRSSPKKTLSPTSPSVKSSISLPLHDLLLLSPSPGCKSKLRLAERLEMAEEPAESNGSRRRVKSRVSTINGLGCNSPRNCRRPRRRLEQEIREERDLGVMEEMVRARKKRQSGKLRKEKLGLVTSSTLSPKISDGVQSKIDQIGQLIADLVMWKDVGKSTLWFGFGSLCFLSSCFSKGLTFSFFSAISQLCLLILGASFFSNSFCQRENSKLRCHVKLKEEDILRAARIILPVVNLGLSKTRDLFSGEPSMTLKIAPILLIGAEYGHLITFWRLSAFGFFIGFTAPKLYSCYSLQINKQADYMKCWVLQAWGACSHKKVVAASAITAFWNLSTLKIRIFTAFISLVIFRHHRQCQQAKLDEVEEGKREEGHKKQALVVVATE